MLWYFVFSLSVLVYFMFEHMTGLVKHFCKHYLVFMQFGNYNTFSVPRKKRKADIYRLVILWETACIVSL